MRSKGSVMQVLKDPERPLHAFEITNRLIEVEIWEPFRKHNWPQ